MTHNEQNNRTDVCGYNARGELTSAGRAELVSAAPEYAYQYDDIGNRESSSERGTNSVYTANNLNQYTAVDDFTPQFDDDGNQTLIKTATGVWQVQYNGENRPILWSCIQSNNSNNTNNQTISMSFDRMGRRVTKNAQRFVYDGYLQIANFEHQTSNIKLQTFIWDPTEPIATRPIVWGQHEGAEALNFQLSTLNFYTHDGNKNVSDMVSSDVSIVAHYDYAPFGALTSAIGDYSNANVWRFSSEYAEDDLGLVYYNYRHYDPVTGRWAERDFIWERGGHNLYAYCINRPSNMCDRFGLYSSWVIETHQNILEHALNSLLDEGVASCLKNDAALKEYVLEALKNANAGMDEDEYATDDKLYLHFNRKMDEESDDDIKKVIEKYKEELENRRRAASDDIAKGLCVKALVQFGELTHMTQDYWGHGVSYDYKAKKETRYYEDAETGATIPYVITVYPSDDVIGEATGDPDNPTMKPSNYNGKSGDSEHGPIYGREPGNRAPDGTGWALPGKWNYNEGRLGKAVDYTKQDLRKYLGGWCEKCCDLLKRSYQPYYGPRPTMPEVVGALNSLDW